MPNFVRHTILPAVIAIFITISYSFQNPYANYKDLLVIGNVKSVSPTLNQTDFDKIIHGEKQKWGNGNNIVIALMKSTHPIGKLTAETIYETTGKEMNRLWLGLVFEGKAKAPKFFMSEEELINFVSNTPGAIGVISKTSNNAKVKTIDIH